MTSELPSDRARRLLQARTYLYGLKTLLYPGRNIRFEVEKSYRSFHGMLKRDMLHSRFGVWEMLAEASLAVLGKDAIITLHYPQELASEDGRGIRGLEDLFRTFSGASGTSDQLIRIGEKEYNLEVWRPGPGRMELQLTLQPSSHRSGFCQSTRTILRPWIGARLSEWMKDNANLALLDVSDPLLRMESGRWEISRRVSTIDLDLSGENPPHAFRWKEMTLAETSTYSDLDDHDVAAILQASGVRLPPDAHRIAKLREALPRGRACLLLRYTHRLPDPASESDLSSSETDTPIWMNKGSVVMENDYLEILIDAGTGKVFSIDGKWRPVPPTP